MKHLSFVSGAFLALFALALAGCQPQIGDKCALNTDCSTTGARQCDVSMPGGYCTVFNCSPNSCPNQSACYLFHAEVQGCPYDDRQPSRTAHSFCMEDCAHNSDCRPGYICSDLRGFPWNAILLDDNQDQDVCVPQSDNGFYESGQPPAEDAGLPPICQAYPDSGAEFPAEPDAGVAAPDAASEEGGTDAGAPDAAPDATISDGGIDATVPDAGGDASSATDAGVSDATLD